MKSNQLPKNKSVYFLGRYAEIFYQTTNADHIAASYRDDMDAPGKGRFHDLLFRDIAKALSGNVKFVLIDEKTDKYRSLSLHNGNLYVDFIHLKKREDCKDTVFAVILSIYRTHHEKDRSEFDAYERDIKEAFGKVH